MYRNPTNTYCNDIKEIPFNNAHGYKNMTPISKTYNEDFSGMNLSNGNYTTTFTSNQEISKLSNLRIKAIPQTDTKIVPHPLLSEKTDTKSLKKSEIRSIYNMNFRNDDFTSKFSKYSTIKMGIQVTDIIKKVITNIEDPNLTIKIGDVNFSCHWEVLLTFANYFDSAIIKKKIIEIPKSHITAIGFDMSYQWMICDQPMLERNYIIDLFQAADFLQIESLMQHCWISIDNGLCFTEDRAFALYLESRKTNLKQLRVPMLHRISKYFLPIVATYDFLELNYDEICTLLSSNLLAVNSELEIFFAAIKWLLHNWEERKKYLENIINCVRFMFISPLFLVGINNTNPMMFLRAIGENQKLCNSIVDGIQYSTIHTIHGCNPVKCAQLLEQCQLTSPKARKWLHDYECEYHHDFFCQRKGFMSYELFLKYLEKISLKGKDYWMTVGMQNKDTKGLKQCCIQAKIN